MNSLIEKHQKTLAISLGTIAALTLLFNTIFKKDKKELPLVPYYLPFLGSTKDCYKNPRAFVKKYTLKYGEAFRAHLQGKIVPVLGGQDAVDVFKHRDLSFVASKMKFVGVESLFSNGNALPYTLLYDTITKHMIPNLNLYGARSYKKLRELLGNDMQDNFEVDSVLTFSRDVVSRSVATTLLGTSLSQNENLITTFKTCVEDISNEQRPGLIRFIFPIINKLYIHLLRPRSGSALKHKKVIKDALISEIERRKRLEELGIKSDEKYLIDYMIESYPREVDDAYIESLARMVYLLIFVGIHTTSDASGYIIYQLLIHPEYVDELREEQEEIFCDHPDQEFVPELAKKMVKLDSFIRESLRSRMDGLGLAHTNIGKEDIKFASGAVVSPGEEVFINMWQLHNTSSDELHTKDLEQFQGFRYVKTDKISTQTSSEYMAFGLGRRACPGRWFAIHQIKAVLSVLLRNYDMTLVGPICPTQGDPGLDGAIKFTRRT